MKTQTPQTRTCRTCRKDYDHDPVIAGGIDLLAGVYSCLPCSEAKEEADTRAKREEEARLVFERVVPICYRKTDTAHPQYPQEFHAAAQKWALGQRPANSIWLGIIGPPGLGKTRVLSQTLKRMIWNQGVSPEWATSTRFAWHCENLFDNEHGKNARFWLDRYLRAGVLVFDDLGKQKWTERVCAQFFDLLEYRNAHMLPLLWSSNELLDVLGESIPEKQRGPILDRLSGNSFTLKKLSK